MNRNEVLVIEAPISSGWSSVDKVAKKIGYESEWVLFFRFLSFMCECLAGLYPCAPRVYSVGGVTSPGTGVTNGCEPLCRCWELNPGHLKSTKCF